MDNDNTQSQPATSAPAAAPQVDLSKYKMAFKGINYEQLMQLVRSSTLLEPEDHPKFEEKYKTMQDQSELDKAFNVLFEEEKEYLEEEIVEINKLLAGELKDDQQTKDLLQSFNARLDTLKQIETALTGNNMPAAA